MIDRKTFFAHFVQARRQRQPLNQSQVDGFDAILDEWERTKGDDLRQLAYMLATAWHGTGTAMHPIIETQRPDEGPVSEDIAIARLEASRKKDCLRFFKRPYWRRDGHGRSYLGRGLVQLTHERNYRALGDAIGVDLVANPALALDLRIAIRVMFVGMERGLFTGHSLDQYFSNDLEDWFDARRIINGVEWAGIVARYGQGFHKCLRAAEWASLAKSNPTPCGAGPLGHSSFQPAP